MRIDLPWMFKTKHAIEGNHVWGTLHWNRGGEPAGSITYRAIMDDSGNERLELAYTRGEGADAERVQQTIRLTFTKPHYGGKRWWMICPYRGVRCSKLFKPGNGDRFASRKAWRIAYQSQRGSWHDRPFDKLNRLQRKLGCPEGYEEWIRRPKGMWRRTYERHEARYWQINEECDRVWVGMMARLGVMKARL